MFVRFNREITKSSSILEAQSGGSTCLNSYKIAYSNDKKEMGHTTLEIIR